MASETEFKKIIMFGCGGHSRSVVDVLLSAYHVVELVFVDDTAEVNEQRYGFPVLNNAPTGDWSYFIAVGDNEQRKNKYIELAGKELVTVSSRQAYVSKRASIGSGCFIGNFVHVGPEATIGANSIINTAAIVEHEVEIGKHCHIGPNAAVSGRCKIGDLVFVGVGAIIKDYISICSGVIIGAGAVVVKDIIEPGVYAGCPAKKIK